MSTDPVTANPQKLWATGQYRKIQHDSRAEAADPVELVAMLYEELETALGVLIAMQRGGQAVSATEPAHRARNILIGLDAGLDHRGGGALATSLSQIYGSMRRRIDAALIAHDGAALEEVLRGVQSLNGAWQAIRK
jgi:flagellar secretion chaperone FliS